MARPLSQRRVNSAGADLCGLSLVEQGRANGLDRSGLKGRSSGSQTAMAQVCLNRRYTHGLGIKVSQVQV